LPDLKQKFEAVRTWEVEVGDVILIKESDGDLRAPYSVDEITAVDELLTAPASEYPEFSGGGLLFKVKPTRSDVVGKSRYYFPGQYTYAIRRIV
jgi:hypothetical protein